ncbi:MAG: hypothetical protein LBG48_01680, partial [Rickettsiales bacterium]|nr:hypothetical protein [Rickettsiales bacterium]
MNKENIKQSYNHWLRGDGLFHNVDGSVSDRWVLAYIIICVSLLVIFIWAFGKEPKPEYAFKLLSMYVSIVLPLLIGGQTAENYFRRKVRNENKDEPNDNEVKTY